MMKLIDVVHYGVAYKHDSADSSVVNPINVPSGSSSENPLFNSIDENPNQKKKKKFGTIHRFFEKSPKLKKN